MNYNGIDCAYCGKKFEQTDDVVVCPVCGTPHHRNCWNENGRCVNAEKHIEGYIWQNSAHFVQSSPVEKNNVKICPVCGQENELFEPVCTRCGERLKKSNNAPYGNAEPQYGNWNQAPEYQYNPYQNVHAQDARTVFGDNSEIDGIPVTEMAEYIQKDSTKYISKFMTMNEKNTKFSWNWSAALVAVYWCFYRKMIGLGIAIMAVVFSVNLAAGSLTVAAYERLKPEVYAEYTATLEALEYVLVNPENADYSMEYYELYTEYMTSPITITTSVISVATTFIISIIMGFLGNNFYKKKVIKDINSIRRVATDSTAYHIYLRQKGSVSVVNLLLPMLFNSILNMMTSFF